VLVTSFAYACSDDGPAYMHLCGLAYVYLQSITVAQQRVDISLSNVASSNCSHQRGEWTHLRQSMLFIFRPQLKVTACLAAIIVLCLRELLRYCVRMYSCVCVCASVCVAVSQIMFVRAFEFVYLSLYFSHIN